LSDAIKIPAYESQIGDLVEGRQYYFHPEHERYMFPALVVDVINDLENGAPDGHEWTNDLVCLCADCTIREFPIYWCKLLLKHIENR